MKNNEIIHQWSIACDKSSVDQGSNLLSLFNIVDEITVSNLSVSEKKVDLKDMSDKNVIVVQKEMDYVSLWRRSVLQDKNSILERNLKFEWVSPSGKVLTTNESPMQFGAGKQNMRMILRINTIAITVPGTYCIRLSSKESDKKSYITVAETPIDIKIV